MNETKAESNAGGSGVSEVIISTGSRYRNIAFQTGITVKLKLFLIIVVGDKKIVFLRAEKGKIEQKPRRKNLHAKNRSATSYIQNDLILEKMCVLVDSVLVRVCSHFVFLARIRY